MASSKELVPASEYAALQMEPAALQEVIKTNIGNTQLTEFDLDRITMPAGGGRTWEVPTLEGIESTPVLEGVIVYTKTTRAWWHQSLDDSGGGTPPDCSSPDAEHATSRPGSPDPGAPADEQGFLICERCPKSQWGSDPREGSNAQDCKQMRMLFLLTPGDMLPIAVSLPPTSLQPANKYMLRLSRAGVPYFGVITKITLEQVKGTFTYSRAIFELGGRLEGDQAEKIRQYAEAMRPAFEKATVLTAAEAGATS
jgi:hypothetical protein